MSIDHVNRVILNIGGTRFEAYVHTLKKIPATRLSRLSEQSPNFDPILNEYFFDRHPGVFPQILNYYRTGKLHYPANVCGPLFEEELEFWGLDSNQVEPCCWMMYTKHRTTEETLAALDRIEKTEISNDNELRSKFAYDLKETLACHQKLRMSLWQLFEEPHSSLFAKVVTSLTLFFIVLSVVIFNTNSLPNFQQQTFARSSFGTSSCHRNEHSKPSSALIANTSILPNRAGQDDVINKAQKTLNISSSLRQISLSSINSSRTIDGMKSKRALASAPFTAFKLQSARRQLMRAAAKQQRTLKTEESIDIVKPTCPRVRNALTILDLVANLYLAIEVILRFLVSPSKITFFKSPVNIIDVIASFWYFVVLLAKEYLGIGDNYIIDLTSNIRVFRIFQVLHHHTGLRIIVASLEASASVLYLFVFVFLIGMVIGATLVYYAERIFANNTYQETLRNKSIFHWWWFAVVTSTTVGYGDYVPRTALGKLVGACCAVIGVLATDIPMAIIVQTFSDFYKHQSVRSKLQQRRSTKK